MIPTNHCKPSCQFVQLFWDTLNDQHGILAITRADSDRLPGPTHGPECSIGRLQTQQESLLPSHHIPG